MNDEHHEKKESKTVEKLKQTWDELDKKIFIPIMGFFLIVIISSIVDPTATKKAYQGVINWLAFNMDWAYIAGACAVILILIWSCFGKTGDIKLGTPDDTPEFSTISWIAMMFGASIGMSILVASVVEPILYFHDSIWVAPEAMGKAEGTLDGIKVGLFHYGFTAWGFYSIAGLAIALPAFRMSRPMTLSIGLYGILKEKSRSSSWGWGTDMLGLIASIGGISSGLGLGILSFVYAFKKYFDIDLTMGGQLGIVIVLSIFFTASAVSGLQRGLKWISNLNIAVFAGLLLFVLMVGPTRHILNTSIQLAGDYLSSFIEMNFFTDASSYKDGEWAQRSWLNWWTVMYWMWFVAYMPFVGGFLARISKGRTIREYVVGSVVFPTIMVWIVFSIFGTTACDVDVAGTVDLYAVSKTNYAGPLYEMVGSLPMGGLFGFLALFSSILFGITTFDSASYFISMQTTKGRLNPSILIRLFWGMTLGVIAVLLIPSGGIQAA